MLGPYGRGRFGGHSVEFTELSEKRKAFFGERLKSHPELTPLRDKLLEIDGLEVVPRPESDLTKLLERGRLYDLDVELRLMRRSGCHVNTALLWMDNMEENKICVGWGLSDDGLWRQHTWIINKEIIIETTEKRIRYFGAILTEDESKAFAFYNTGIRN